MSVSTVRLLPTQPCQEEMEHPGPVCRAWKAPRELRMLGAESSTPARDCLHCVQVLMLWKRWGMRELTGCQTCPAWPRPREEGSPWPPVSLLSSLRPGKMGLGPERLHTKICKLPKTQARPLCGPDCIPHPQHIHTNLYHSEFQNTRLLVSCLCRYNEISSN